MLLGHLATVCRASKGAIRPSRQWQKPVCSEGPGALVERGPGEDRALVGVGHGGERARGL